MVRRTLYVKKCRVSAGFVKKVADRGAKRTYTIILYCRIFVDDRRKVAEKSPKAEKIVSGHSGPGRWTAYVVVQLHLRRHTWPFI